MRVSVLIHCCASSAQLILLMWSEKHVHILSDRTHIINFFKLFFSLLLTRRGALKSLVMNFAICFCAVPVVLVSNSETACHKFLF